MKKKRFLDILGGSAGSYLPIAGGAMMGSIAMGENDVNSCVSINGNTDLAVASSLTSNYVYIKNSTTTRMTVGNGVIYSYLPISQAAGTVGGNGYDYITKTYDANDTHVQRDKQHNDD